MSSDLVTELQRHLRDVNDQFSAVVEQLVHIAPPAAIDNDTASAKEDEPSAAAQADLQEKARELSRALAQRFKDINSVINKLPDLNETPDHHDARIAALLKEHYTLRKELGTVMQEAERKLEEVHGCYEVLSQHALSQAGKMAGTSV